MKQHPTWQSTGSIVAERLGKVSELMLAMRGKVHLIPYMPKPFELHHIARSDGSVTQMKWWDARLVAKAERREKDGMKRAIFAELLTKKGEMTELAKIRTRFNK
jgi:hypothetical protein